jgi:hypothetical protein
MLFLKDEKITQNVVRGKEKITHQLRNNNKN